MPYSVLRNFERGIDARRLIDCTDSGALLDAKDCHITRGGEIEKRPAFVVVSTLPPGTMGFYATDGPIYHVWGDTAAPAGLPPEVVYHQITDPSVVPSALEYILSVEEFSGKLYVVARYEDGKTIHWWDDVPVREFDPPPVTITPDDPADPPIEVDPPPPPVPGAKPSVTVTFVHISPQSPLFGTRIWSVLLMPPSQLIELAVPLVLTGAFTDQGMPVMNPTVVVPIGDGSGSNIAATIAQLVNSYTSVPEILAVPSGNKVTFTVNDANTTYNGWSIHVAVFTGFQAIPSIAPLSGGLAPIVPGSLLEVFGAKTPAIEPFADGDPKPLEVLGTFAVAHNMRMYAFNSTLMKFSMEENPSRWDRQSLTAGEIDHSMMSKAKPILVGACDYQDGLAVFALRHVFIWRTDPLPTEFQKKQVLHRTGTASPHSITPYSESEVMYLDRSGIRSLRTRTGLDMAFSGDFGNLIDRLIAEKIKTMTLTDRFRKVWGEVEPNSGRLWMSFGDVIYVLSYYPDTNIIGWSYYDASEFPIEFLNANYTNIFWRSGDDIIAFGGVAGDEYDDTEAMVRVPYIDAEKPANVKNWTAVDVAALGTWQIKASFDATAPLALDLIANVTKSTYAQQKIAVNGQSPSVSLELRTSYVGPARIGNAAVHYTDAGAD